MTLSPYTGVIDAQQHLPPGIHDYQAMWGCLRRWRRSKEDEGFDGGEDADFGVTTHRFLERYHQYQPVHDLTATMGDESRELLSRYTERFAPGSFGRVLHGEQRLAADVNIDGCRIPFGGTIDAIVELDAAACERIALDRRIVGLEPGRYNVDHKTKKSHTRSLIVEYANAPQFTGYHLLHEFHYGEGSCKGTFVNVLFRYKKDDPATREKQFITFFIPPPTEEMIAEFAYVLKGAVARREQLGDDHVVPTRCFDFFRVCPALMEGCQRS